VVISQYSRSHDAVIRVHDDAGNVIEMHEHAGEVQRVVATFIDDSSAMFLP